MDPAALIERLLEDLYQISSATIKLVHSLEQEKLALTTSPPRASVVLIKSIPQESGEQSSSESIITGDDLID